MATLRAHRLLQSIESKNINSAQLEAILAGNLSRQTDLPLLLRAHGDRVLAPETFPTILESASAVTGIANSTPAMRRVAASLEAMSMVAGSLNGSVAMSASDIAGGLVMASRENYLATIAASSNVAVRAPWAKQWRFGKGVVGTSGSIAIGSTGLIMAAANASNWATSEDGGVSWLVRTSGGPTVTPTFLGFAGSYFLAFTSGAIQTSYSTGGGWIAGATLPVAGSWGAVANLGSYYATLITNTPSTSAAYTTTPNTGTWTASSLPANQHWKDLNSSSTTFIAVGGSTNIAATSTTGASWAQRTLPSNANWSSVAAGKGADNGKFMVVGGASSGAYSPNHGASWSSITLPVSNIWTRVAYHPDTRSWVLFGSNPLVATSVDDGVTWVTRVIGTTNVGNYPVGSIGAGGPYVLAGSGATNYIVNV